MNPSFQPFPSGRSSARPPPPPFSAQRPPRALFPPYQPGELNNYHQPHHQQQPFQPPMLTQSTFHPSPHVNVQNAPAPITTPEALVTDMWRTCPALCRSIRQDFDLPVIFHPALIAYHGETFVRLAASQIAMQNQAAEMTQMRNVILQKQKQLEVNTASTEDLQQKLVAQQSELKEIRDLLHQQTQSLTNPDAGNEEKARGSEPRENEEASKAVSNAPVTPALTVTTIDRPIHNFYSRSASLAPLNVSLPQDDVDKHDEKHGYGHAETKGPAVHYELGKEGVQDSQVEMRAAQSLPAAPTVSTSPVFEPIDTSARPIVSLGAKKQAANSREDRQQFENVGKDTAKAQTFDAMEMTKCATVTIMKREEPHEPGASNLGKLEKATNSETPKQERHAAPVTPPRKNDSQNQSHQSLPTIQQTKPASYAAAVRTTPETALNDESSTLKQTPATSQDSPAVDLGFTLEPLPKPTVQQVQSQQQQAQPSAGPDSFQPPTTSHFDFEEWKQRKIAAGTWQDRTGNKAHTENYQQRPYHHSTYRGRGIGGPGRFNHCNNENLRPGRFHHNARDNFRSGAMKEEEWK